jgi:hypothetical protein
MATATWVSWRMTAFGLVLLLTMALETAFVVADWATLQAEQDASVSLTSAGR